MAALTREQTEAFWRDGFLVAENAVTPAQLAALTSRILASRQAAVAILGPRAALGAAESFEQALFN